jgi:hypothetical protein
MLNSKRIARLLLLATLGLPAHSQLLPRSNKVCASTWRSVMVLVDTNELVCLPARRLGLSADISPVRRRSLLIRPVHSANTGIQELE